MRPAHLAKPEPLLRQPEQQPFGFAAVGTLRLRARAIFGQPLGHRLGVAARTDMGALPGDCLIYPVKQGACRYRITAHSAHPSLLTPHSSLLTPHSSLLTPHSWRASIPALGIEKQDNTRNLDSYVPIVS